MSVFANAVGLVGVVLFLLAYTLLQFRKIKSESVTYSLMNLLGAVLILFSLLYAWNLPSFILESAWALVSIYGLVYALKTKV